MHFLTNDAKLFCNHGGEVILPDGSAKWIRVSKKPVLVAEKIQGAPIKGCSQTGPGLFPCTKVSSVLAGKYPKVKIGGKTPLLSTALCMTNGSPPGFVSMKSPGPNMFRLGAAAAASVANKAAAAASSSPASEAAGSDSSSGPASSSAVQLPEPSSYRWEPLDRLAGIDKFANIGASVADDPSGLQIASDWFVQIDSIPEAVKGQSAEGAVQSIAKIQNETEARHWRGLLAHPSGLDLDPFVRVELATDPWEFLAAEFALARKNSGAESLAAWMGVLNDVTRIFPRLPDTLRLEFIGDPLLRPGGVFEVIRFKTRRGPLKDSASEPLEPVEQPLWTLHELLRYSIRIGDIPTHWILRYSRLPFLKGRPKPRAAEAAIPTISIVNAGSSAAIRRWECDARFPLAWAVSEPVSQQLGHLAFVTGTPSLWAKLKPSSLAPGNIRYLHGAHLPARMTLPEWRVYPDHNEAPHLCPHLVVPSTAAVGTISSSSMEINSGNVAQIRAAFLGEESPLPPPDSAHLALCGSVPWVATAAQHFAGWDSFLPSLPSLPGIGDATVRVFAQPGAALVHVETFFPREPFPWEAEGVRHLNYVRAIFVEVKIGTAFTYRLPILWTSLPCWPTTAPQSQNKPPFVPIESGPMANGEFASRFVARTEPPMCLHLDPAWRVATANGNILQSAEEAAQLRMVAVADRKKAASPDDKVDAFRALAQAARDDQRKQRQTVGAKQRTPPQSFSKAAKFVLQDQAAADLVKSDFEEAEFLARCLYPEFDQYPSEARRALLEMVHTFGNRLPTRLPSFDALIRLRRWEAAADQCRRPDVSERRNRFVQELLMRARTEPARMFTAAEAAAKQAQIVIEARKFIGSFSYDQLVCNHYVHDVFERVQLFYDRDINTTLFESKSRLWFRNITDIAGENEAARQPGDVLVFTPATGGGHMGIWDPDGCRVLQEAGSPNAECVRIRRELGLNAPFLSSRAGQNRGPDFGVESWYSGGGNVLRVYRWKAFP